MNRFIELIGFVCKTANADLGLPDEEREIKLAVKPAEIVALRESMRDDDKLSIDECVIYLKSGETFVVKHNYESLIKWLNDI